MGGEGERAGVRGGSLELYPAPKAPAELPRRPREFDPDDGMRAILRTSGRLNAGRAAGEESVAQ